MGHVTCHVSCIKCPVSCLAWHLSPTMTATYTYPPPANSSTMFMHSSLVRRDRNLVSGNQLIYQKPIFCESPKKGPIFFYKTNWFPSFVIFSNTLFDQQSPIHVVRGPSQLHKQDHRDTNRNCDL